MQAQLSLSRGGLGLHSLSCHSVAAYLASLSSSGFDKSFNLHMSKSIGLFNDLVPTADSITEEIVATSYLCQYTLSSIIEDQQFHCLISPLWPIELTYYQTHHIMLLLGSLLTPLQALTCI